MPEDPIIKTQNLAVGYGSKVILQDLNLDIRPGSITVILGGSGCGKSTLLKTLLKLQPALGGQVEILGEKLMELSEREYETLTKKLGVLFQNGALINSLHLYDNVSLPLEQHTKLPFELRDRMVRKLLDRVGLGTDLWKLPEELSGGMRKRAALARALILSPPVLFCDEPSAGLDPLTAAELDRLLLELKAMFRMTIIVVTHELASIHRIAEDIIFLSGGRALYQGPLEQALNSEHREIKDFFDASHISCVD